MNLFTPEEFEIEYYKRMHEWIQGGKRGVDPRENWENYAFGKWGSCIGTPSFVSKGYRWKPSKKRTVTIDGNELVAPETGAPNIGEIYFVSDNSRLSELQWDGEDVDYMWLKAGFVFLTSEDAKAMYDAQMKQRLGIAS